MSSMSYCELQNAATDLGSAVYDIANGEKSWSREEYAAAHRIVGLASELAEYLEGVDPEGLE